MHLVEYQNAFDSPLKTVVYLVLHQKMNALFHKLVSFLFYVVSY